MNGQVSVKSSIQERQPLPARVKEKLAGKTGAAARAALVEVLSGALEKGRRRLREKFESGRANGRSTAHGHSLLIDQILKLIAKATVEHVHPIGNATTSERLALVATGGYGRGELAPFSDVDLLFLVPDKRAPWVESVIESILYTLWDLGLKIGHAVRTTDEAIRLSKDDISIRTAFLDARLIWGDEALFDETNSRFQRKVVAGTGPAFVEEKLQERGQRHIRMGDSRYVVEPNVKDGKGGLRDLHTLYWIGRYLYGVSDLSGLVEKDVLSPDEARAFRKAENFLWTVRCHLHLETSRAEDRLGFDLQRPLARRLGYKDHPGLSGVERFMKHYFLTAKQVGDLTRIFCAVLEERHQKRRLINLKKFARRRKIDGFPVDSGRLSIKAEDRLRKNPLDIIRIFRVADKHGYDIHPDALRHISRNLHLIDRAFRRDPEANRLFIEILTSRQDCESALRRMNEAGVLGRFLPDFGRIVAQSQFDMYHHYTVDEHTIRAIGLLAKLEKGLLAEEDPVASEAIKAVTLRQVLFVGVLLHDIAKGRGGNHSEIGGKIANQLCPRFGFSPAETELTNWLVRQHLVLSHFAFKRDISDPTTVENFVQTVKSPERLRLLAVLTAVDIRAVGPGTWNAWKGRLIAELYYAAEERLVAGHVSVGREDRLKERQEALAKRLRRWKAKEKEAHFKRFGDAYWLGEDAGVLAFNARLVKATNKAGSDLGVDYFIDEADGVTRVSVFTKDRPGIFAGITGALAVLGANIRDAKIFTARDGWALDNFAIQDDAGGPFNDRARLARIEPTIRKALEGKLDTRAILERPSILADRTDVFHVRPFALVDNKASHTLTVIEVNARDRYGLLFDLASALAERRVSVQSAHVATYGERAVDVFYVQEQDGGKITHGQRIAGIKRRLIAAVDRPGAARQPSGIGKRTP